MRSFWNPGKKVSQAGCLGHSLLNISDNCGLTPGSWVESH